MWFQVDIIGVVAVVVAVPIDWNAMNALYEFFVVFPFLVLDLGMILVPTRRQFCLVGVIVVLFLSVVLDGAVVAVACIVVVFVFEFFLLVSSSVVCGIFVVVCGGVVIIGYDICV